jgi:putative ABC transport system permease protein
MHNVDYWNIAAPGSLEMLGVPLLKGRMLEARDGEGAPNVVVVNETFEKRFYNGESALERRIKPNGRPEDNTPWFTIVGVVKDIKNQGLHQPAAAELFFSLPQNQFARGGTLLVKSSGGDPWRILAPVRKEIQEIDATLPIAQVRPLDDVISVARAQPRFLALLLGLFALVALGLAATGIFSVMSYSVAQRTNEFGIRMALGAAANQVMELVLKQGMGLVMVGLLIGAAGSWALSRSMRGIITGLSEVHWEPLVVTGALLIAVTIAACWTPARRATQVDPANALRVE